MLDYSLTKLFIIEDKKDQIIKEVAEWEKKNPRLITYSDIYSLADLLRISPFKITVSNEFVVTLYFETRIAKWKKELLGSMLNKYLLITHTYSIVENLTT